MNQEANTIEAVWNGPYSWSGFEEANKLPAIPNKPGVYLQTFEYNGGYLIYAAGITRRTVPARLSEHTRKYMSGEYNVLDIAAAEQGVRKEIWHGWDYARRHREEFEERKSIILDAVRRQLLGFRVFVSDTGTERRLLERIEAAIMNHLNKQPTPFCDIPDKGMMLAPRWTDEKPLVMKNLSKVKLHRLPVYLEI